MFAARGGFLANEDTGPVINFPANSIVPFYGTSVPVLADWNIYSSGSGKYIAGTTDPAKLQTATNSRNASMTINATDTAGAHNGYSTFVSGAWKRGASNLNDTSNLLAGNHVHTIGSVTFTPTMETANVRLLVANKATPTMPAGTLGFRDPATGSYGTRMYSDWDSRYMVNGTTGGTSSGPGGQQVTRTTSSSGSHQHNNNNFLYYSAGSTFYPTALSSGTHSHTLTAYMSQTLMSNTMVLAAWTSAIARAPATDVIVMYNGLISNLTGTGWYLCNGLNGTLNISDYFVGIGSNWGDTFSSDGQSDGVIINGGGDIHQHNNGTNGSSGVYAYHPGQSWYHTHTSTTSNFVDFIGAKFYLHFIQYKG